MNRALSNPQASDDRYVQARADYIRKKAVEFILLGMVLVGGVGGGIASAIWIASNPALSRWYWLLPLIVVAAVLEVFLIQGPELVRHRFEVDAGGFTPPFLRSRRWGADAERRVRFEAVSRVGKRTYVRAGRIRLYGITVETADGRRFTVRESDVGEEGLQRLSRALSSPRPPGTGPMSATDDGPSPGLRREITTETLAAVGLILVLALSVTLMFAVGNPDSYSLLVLLTIAVLGTVFAAGWVLSIRRRAGH